MINYNIPFYSNTSDDTHCFQAVLKMVIDNYDPQIKFSWKDLDKISDKQNNKWTWPISGYIWLKENNYDIQIIEPFDYKKFIKHDGDYLIEEYGVEVGTAQINNSDIKKEQINAKNFIKLINYQKRIPKINEIIYYLNNKYLIICNVNANKLINHQGYTGHFVLIKGYNNKGLFLHDPGLPPRENIYVDLELFERAWSYPNEKAKNICAVKK
jgi:hypothetical protein